MLLGFLTSAQAQEKAADARILEIKLDRVNLPGEVRGNSPTPELNKDWYSIEVKFSTEVDVPQVQVRFFVEAVQDVFAEEAKAKDQGDYLVLTGDQTYLNVPKGREHYAVMYLDPMSLARYGGKDGERGFKQMNVHAQLSLGSAIESEKDMKQDDEGWFEKGRQVAGVLIGLRESPFWPSLARRYNRVKGN